MKRVVATGLCLVIAVELAALLFPDRRFVLMLTGVAVALLLSAVRVLLDNQTAAAPSDADADDRNQALDRWLSRTETLIDRSRQHWGCGSPGCNSPPTCCPPTCSAPPSTTCKPVPSSFGLAQSSRICCWPTKSTAPRPRRRRRCWRRWPKVRSPSTVSPIGCPHRSSCWPPTTVVSLAVATRQHPQVAVGASPRAELDLVQLARARALLLDRDYVIPEDVKTLAVPSLAHRIMLRPEMWVRQIRSTDVLGELLRRLPVPRAGGAAP